MYETTLEAIVHVLVPTTMNADEEAVAALKTQKAPGQVESRREEMAMIGIVHGPESCLQLYLYVKYIPTRAQGNRRWWKVPRTRVYMHRLGVGTSEKTGDKKRFEIETLAHRNHNLYKAIGVVHGLALLDPCVLLEE